MNLKPGNTLLTELRSTLNEMIRNVTS